MKATAARAAKKSTPAPKKAATPAPDSPARVRAILTALRKAYPDAACALRHKDAWQLLVATILSAQCTDVRVNLVTPELFRLFPTPAALARAPLPAIEQVIRSTGFFRNKAKSISGAARLVSERFSGAVPRTMDELLTLPGVARKTANVVLGTFYGIADGVVVDTHVSRIAQRLALTRATDPARIEADLMRVLPRPEWVAFSHRIIHHGRAVCIARRPRCAACPLLSLCTSADKTV